MSKLPIIIATSVIRSVKQGESHGGVYIVNLDTNVFKKVIDWNKCGIDWRGRGGDRGLRGVAVYGENIFLAASDELFYHDSNFNLIDSFRNQYLKHCHEIYLKDSNLYISSTGFDSILEFNTIRKKFTAGYYIFFKKGLLMNKDKLKVKYFNPQISNGPLVGDNLHINSVYKNNSKIFFAGTNLGWLYCMKNQKVYKYASVPTGTHNAFPYENKIMYNDTASNRVVVADKKGEKFKQFKIKEYNAGQLLKNNLGSDHARQSFGRGLLVYKNYIISGSSPATISVYHLGEERVVKTINISMDVRNSIHGLEILH